MPLLLFLIEIFIFVTLIQEIGFWYSVLVYLVPTILGFMIFKNQNKALVMNIQNNQNPSKDLIKKGLTFIAAILLIFPSFLTKVLGIFILLPFVRTLLSWGFQGFLLKKVFSSTNAFYKFGGNGFKFYYQNMNTPPPIGNEWQNSNEEVLEAQYKKIEETNLIDIKPKTRED